VGEDVVTEWRHDANRAALIDEFKRRIEDVRPHCQAAYGIWDRYCVELVRLERALDALLHMDDSLKSCTGHPRFGAQPES